MLSKKWITGVASFLLIILLFAGYMAVAAEAGGKDDPLISLSYIEQLLPKMNEQIDAEISTRLAEFDSTIATRVDELNRSIDDKIRGFEEQYAAGFTDAHFLDKLADLIISKGGVTSNGDGSEDDGSAAESGGSNYKFTVVDITSGTTVILDLGTEVLWRIGTATCYAPSGVGLIDITAGSELAAGAQLVQNHVYVATVKDRGFKATANCKILIKGEYTTQ